MAKSLRGLVAGVAAAIVVLAGAGQARAEFIQNTFGITAPVRTITFNEHVFPPSTPLTNQYADLGVLFSPNMWYRPQDFIGPHIDIPSIGNFERPDGPTVFRNPFTIQFTEVLTEAAFALITNPGMSLFEALLGGVVVESRLAPTDVTRQDNFYGFRDIEFDAIRVTVDRGTNQAAIMDNIQMGAAIPEPATVTLLSVGALGLLGYGWRRRRPS